LGSGFQSNVMSATSASVQQTQPVPPSGMSKLKKVEWYAGQLVNDAVEKEKSGSIEEAIVLYLNASDILLLLAKGQDNYSVWKGYSDRAMQCQQRARVLMAQRK
jgi:MIT (microtubule interacting and transport) domain